MPSLVELRRIKLFHALGSEQRESSAGLTRGVCMTVSAASGCRMEYHLPVPSHRGIPGLTTHCPSLHGEAVSSSHEHS